MAGELYKVEQLIAGAPTNCRQVCTEGGCYTETTTEQVFVVDGYEGAEFASQPYGHYEEQTVTETVCPDTCNTVCDGTEPAVDRNLGWNASARSLESIEENGAFEFRISEAALGVVVGFNEADYAVTGYADLHYGLYASRGSFKVLEQGVFKTGSVAFVSGDWFRIERDHGTVRYYHNGSLIRTASRESTGPVFLEAVLYMAEDRILEAKRTTVALGQGALSFRALRGYGRALPLARAGLYFQYLEARGYDNGAITGSADLALEPMDGFGGEGTYAEATDLWFQPLRGSGSAGTHLTDGRIHAEYLLPVLTGSGSGTNILTGTASLDLPELEVVASDYLYDYAELTLESLEGHGSGGIHQPQPVTASLALAPLRVNGFMLTGTIGDASLSMEPLVALAADRIYGEGEWALEPLTAVGYEFITLDNVGICLGPGPDFTGQGRESANRMVAEMPFPSVELRDGGAARVEMPFPTADIQASWPNVGRLDARLPGLTADASGLTGQIGGADLDLPSLALSARGAGRADLTLAAFTTDATGQTGGIGILTEESPAFELEASGERINTGTADLTLEALTVHGDAVPDSMETPMPYVRATGEQAA